ncbi:Adhesion G protein-coupled receptor E2, partial [Exaiptasia diaphana]
ENEQENTSAEHAEGGAANENHTFEKLDENESTSTVGDATSENYASYKEDTSASSEDETDSESDDSEEVILYHYTTEDGAKGIRKDMKIEQDHSTYARRKHKEHGSDFDECSVANACHANAQCTNTFGSYDCKCKPGYHGDGKNCSDFDECSVANACHANAQCTNTFGSYDCKCKPGYHGDGKNCSDIDECSSVSDICDPNAQCTNNNGSYTCSCRLGFSGDGKNCSDIDECSSGVYPCHANAICTNTPGSHTCRCRSGFGDGRHTCRTLPKSCNERKKVFPASGSDTYTIDPGGNIGEVPYKVYCDMKDKGGVGVTVISHNRESWDYVNNCPCSPGSCSRIVSYNGASLAQLAKLTEISTRCEQYIHFLCNGDVAFIEASYAWWVSRDGVPQYYWGGATPGSKKCACGMTNTCQNNKGCNCHGGAGGWRADGGYLTDKTTLPVKEMRFGDTDDSNEDAGYYLGKLKCY